MPQSLKDIQLHFDNIDHSKYSVLAPRKSIACFIPSKKRKELIVFYESILSSQVRGDYREVGEISSMLLGSRRRYTAHPPAGDSNARWLSKIIYSAKNYLYQDQLNLDTDTIRKLEEFLVFAVYTYLPAWYMTPFLSEATASDLQFAKELEWFKEINQSVAEEVLTKMQNHSWYIGPELAWTLLFSRKVSNDVKQQIVSFLCYLVVFRIADTFTFLL